jgi:S-adenosylmethionine-diacylgycerolhomoserine-N-methlytransferase
MAALESSAHASLMNGVYRYQRHIYDLTRKYYLLGRDRMIARMEPPPNGTVLELGCGTGRNIVLAARRYPEARFLGLDISTAMLDTAAAALAREGIASCVKLAQGDATAFDMNELFGLQRVDRVFISYSLSMIPQWEGAVAAALTALRPGGSLHIVDFGRQEHLPRWFKRMLRAWLSRFHVSPRDSMREVLESACQRSGASLLIHTLYGGYAVHAVVTLPD